MECDQRAIRGAIPPFIGAVEKALIREEPPNPLVRGVFSTGPSHSRLTTQLPAFAVIPFSGECARILREKRGVFLWANPVKKSQVSQPFSYGLTRRPDEVPRSRFKEAKPMNQRVYCSRSDGEGDALMIPSLETAKIIPGPEFLKNSINIGKFTGFFDKFPKIRFVEFKRIIISLQRIPKVTHQ